MDITRFIVSHRDQARLLGDYNSYRVQLSRRLLTVRKKVGRTSTKGKKYSEREPITADELASNHEYAHLILLTAERAWAHAMHMKSAHSLDTNAKGITGSTRRHIISRLHKASVHAKELLAILTDAPRNAASEADLLEAQAYSSSLDGAVEFEKGHWEDCLTSYAEAHVVYSALLSATKSDVFKDMLSDTVDPSIRYAAYQRRMPRTLAISTIARRAFPESNPALKSLVEKCDPDALKDKSPTSRGDGTAPDSTPKTITWRTKTVQLEDAAIATALASVTAAESQLSQYLSSAATAEVSLNERASAYDAVLNASQEAVDATKRAIDEMAAEGVGQSDMRMQALQITRTAVNYELVGWRIGRNRVLTGPHDGVSTDQTIGTKHRKARADGKEVVKREGGIARKLLKLTEREVLYDATLQSIDSVRELPGIAADGAFLKELRASRNYFEALKILCIARSHILLSHRKNALALLAHALELMEVVMPTVAESSSEKKSGPPRLDIGEDAFQYLVRVLRGESSRCRALVELDFLSAADATGNHAPPQPLIENLHQYPAKGADLNHLVSYPPKVEPVPVKPLFLDVAWNYIEYPGRPSRVEANGERPLAGDGNQEPGKGGTKKGWFGFGR